jgi:hypothetical protein
LVQDSETLRPDDRFVGNGGKMAANPFRLIHVDRSTSHTINHDRVACLAPAQNSSCERLTIIHVPTTIGQEEKGQPAVPEPIFQMAETKSIGRTAQA